MPNETIKDILMRRDGMTEEDAIELIQQAKRDLEDGIIKDDIDYRICEKWFGLEPDYLDELLYMDL